MKSKLSIRILYGAILLVALLFLPWYIPFILGVIGLIYFETYLEFVVVSFLIDSLYGVSGSRFLGIPFFHTLLGAFIFLAYEFIKNQIRIKR